MKVAIGGDRLGFRYKAKLKQHLTDKNIEVIDVGTYEEIPGDSPVFAADVGELVANHKCDYGILICATGTGIAIAANKIKGIMCGIGYDDDVTRKMREHNDANVIAFGANHMEYSDVERRTDIFLNTDFGNEAHHAARVMQIRDLENGKKIHQTAIINQAWKGTSVEEN